MNNSSNKPGSEPRHEPSGSPPEPSPEPEALPRFIMPPEDRIRRVVGVLEAVSDSLCIDSILHSAHLERRALAIDLATDELKAVVGDLETVISDLEGGAT